MLALALRALRGNQGRLARPRAISPSPSRSLRQRDRPPRHHPRGFRAGGRAAGSSGQAVLATKSAASSIIMASISRPCPRHDRQRPGRRPSCRAAPRSPSSLRRRTCSSPTSAHRAQIKEAFLAVWLECNLTKKEILRSISTPIGVPALRCGGRGPVLFRQGYQGYFARRKRHAGRSLQGAARYAPHVKPAGAARERANVVLTNLVQGGLMTEGQVLAARLEPATVVDRAVNGNKAPDFFLDWPLTRCSASPSVCPAFPHRAHHHRSRPAAVGGGGSGGDRLREYGESYKVKQGALVMVENGGAWRAMVGRTRLWRKPVQPRHQGTCASGLVLQGLYLCRRHGEGFHARIPSSRMRRSAGAAGRHKITAAPYAAASRADGARQVHQHHSRAPGQDELGTEIIAETPGRWASRPDPHRQDHAARTSEVTGSIRPPPMPSSGRCYQSRRHASARS